LFKIKRGKREEYIDTEEEMSEIILDMGVEGLTFIKIKGRKKFNNGQFKDILHILIELERIIGILYRRGVNYQKYIHFSGTDPKNMPTYMVKVDGKTQFVKDDKELAKVTKGMDEAEYIEIFEKNDLGIIEKRLNKYGLSIEEFLREDVVEELSVGKQAKTSKEAKKKATKKTSKKTPNLKAQFMIETGKDKNEFFCLKEVLRFVQAQAKKGVHIQRYKGLGEMNPQQLWDTTMDPQKRTLLQVAMDDAVEADKVFTMLMGDEVAPRREFIETNAHDVRNLDI